MNKRQSIVPLKPILVSGAHRTGTTWVGKMLAADATTAYISEPLNVWHRPGVMRIPVQHWYAYICEENEQSYLRAFQEMISFRYHVLREIGALRSLKDLGRFSRDLGTFLNAMIFKKRALIKDPFAIFSAPWFAEKLSCRVVITIRHPAAFASSLKRLNWPFDFRNLLKQPLLMRDRLEPFREKMEEYIHKPDDIIGQASLLWQMVYQVTETYLKEHPDFLLVRHESLALDPLEGYRKLYAALGLEFSHRVQRIILASSAPSNPKEISKRAVYSTRLDSRTNLENWKQRLDKEEIMRIRRLTEPISAKYYPDDDWK